MQQQQQQLVLPIYEDLPRHTENVYKNKINVPWTEIFVFNKIAALYTKTQQIPLINSAFRSTWTFSVVAKSPHQGRVTPRPPASHDDTKTFRSYRPVDWDANWFCAVIPTSVPIVRAWMKWTSHRTARPECPITPRQTTAPRALPPKPSHLRCYWMAAHCLQWLPRLSPILTVPATTSSSVAIGAVDRQSRTAAMHDSSAMALYRYSDGAVEWYPTQNPVMTIAIDNCGLSMDPSLWNVSDCALCAWWLSNRQHHVSPDATVVCAAVKSTLDRVRRPQLLGCWWWCSWWLSPSQSTIR